MSKVINDTEVRAYLVLTDDGWRVRDLDGNLGPVCPENVGGGKYSIKLSPNDANRTYYATKKAYADIERCRDGIPLYLVEKTPVGSVGSKVPNAKLISYLDEADQAEYNAIIERARAAMVADKAKPMTEEEKLQKQIEAAKAKLAKLKAEAAGGNN